ncbi:AzlC family ABC transporter permease [Aquisalimonas sp.]|uniref:AzlC family ABC transporter permease n=1 Tax=Aquisalimonas sp. TaxID=1872621 RepID=UPI0025C469BB|nr:AzlC family ABC transporter permease [Aquisalimonas sp.]
MANEQAAQQVFKNGLRAIAPMLPGVVPFGMTTGIAATEAGLAPLMSMGMSLIIFAGAAQLVIAQLIGDGALPLIIVLTGLIINLRMVMYSASLAPYLGHLSTHWKAAIAYLLTDQAYAVSITHFMHAGVGQHRQWFYMGTAFPLWVLWLLATAAGIWLGAAVPPGWQIGFALPLVFLVLLVPVIRDRPSAAAALTGGGVALAAHDAPYHLGLTIGAIAGVATGVSAELALHRRRSSP